MIKLKLGHVVGDVEQYQEIEFETLDQLLEYKEFLLELECPTIDFDLDINSELSGDEFLDKITDIMKKGSKAH